MSTTTNFNITLPTVNGSPDTWGTIINAAFESFDGLLSTAKMTADAALPKAGGTLTGAVSGTTATFSGTVTAPSFSGNATSASRWQNARTITVTGAATGSVALDGSANASLDLTLAAVPISGVTGLQAALDGKQATGDYPTHASGAGRTITVGNVEPASPLEGDIWFETA